MDELDSYRSDELITREGYAAVLVRFKHRPIYVPSSSRYYTQEHSGHTFGLFQDVPWNHPDFDYIGTAVLAGLIDELENETGEYFDPDGLMTRENLANSIYSSRMKLHSPLRFRLVCISHPCARQPDFID